MIQRIQTLYLLIVTLLATICCFFSFAVVTPSPITFNTAGALHSAWLIPSAALGILIPAIAFGSIFLYKKRILQMRVNSFNMVLMIFQIIAYAVILVLVHRTAPEAEIKISWPCIVPLINLILTYLAIRGIGSDEALVRAADRLR